MAISDRVLKDQLRAKHLESVRSFFEGEGEEVLITGSGELCFPVVDSEGNERWMQVVVKVPSGSRDGDPFDGYSLAEDWQMKCAEKARKAEADAKKKAEKAAKDAKARAAKEAKKKSTT